MNQKEKDECQHESFMEVFIVAAWEIRGMTKYLEQWPHPSSLGRDASLAQQNSKCTD
jgi:hypothetical protein